MKQRTCAAVKGSIDMGTNYDRVSQLLGVLDGVRQLPNLANIHNLAMMELEEINASVADELKKRQEARLKGQKVLSGMPTVPTAATAGPVNPREPVPTDPAAEKQVSEEQQKQAELSGRPVGQVEQPKIGNEPIDPASESLLHTDAHGESISRRA